MKQDNTPPGNPPENDPVLEARIVAWIAGEASTFEIAELERLVAENPELAIFKHRIEAVQGLVGEAVRPEKETLRLSPERRAKLFAAIGAPSSSPDSGPTKSGSVLHFPSRSLKTRTNWLKGLSVACCFLLAFLTLRLEWPRPGRHVFPKSVVQKEKESEVTLPPSTDVLKEIVQSENELALRKNEEERTDRIISGENVRGVTLSSQAPILRPSGGVAVSMPVVPPIGSSVFSSDLRKSAPNVPASLNGPSTHYMSGANAALDFSVVGGTNPAFRQNSIISDVGSPAGTMNAPDDLLSQRHVRDADESSLTPYGNATLAGTRVSPNFKDVASSLSPTTEPTLDDSARLDDPIVLSPFVVGADKNSAPAASTSDRKAAAQSAEIDGGKAENSRTAAARKKSRAKPSPSVGESDAASEPVSTFSLHVGDVSFRLAQAALARGDRPDPASIRPEEFYNAFDYGDPAPALGEKISCRVEQSTHPELQQRNLVRVALRVPSTGRGAGQPLRLTVLLDTSGSMQREDRAAAVQRAMEVLVSLLGPADRITLIGFARQPRLLAESISGDQAKSLLKIIAQVPAEGGTNLEEALKLAAELARRQQDAGAQNRIVLLTDGAANLGDADPAKLAGSIETLRQEGIAFDACGVGLEGIDDTMLEALTRHGDGRYTVLTTPESAELDFARQLAGAFRPAAQNVKVQVRFNPARVAHYRLIGFEQHRLNEEDFRNDKVDAAELAADEAAVAVYEVEARPEGEGELGEVYVRFRDTATGNMIERSWPLPYDAHVTAFDRSSSTMQLAGTAALVAESLQGAPIKLEDLAGPVNALRGRYSHELRVQELVAMYEELRRSDYSEK